MLYGASRLWYDTPNALPALREAAQASYPALSGFFVVMLLLTHIVASQCVAPGGYLITCGLLTYPCTFVATDVASELGGAPLARRMILQGFWASLWLVALLYGVTWLPAHGPSRVGKAALVSVFSLTPGFVLASMAAYLLAQRTDVYLFDKLRAATAGRHLWLRNNVATLVSALLDTLVFGWVAWWLWPLLVGSAAAVPMPWEAWQALARHEYACKVVLALLDTPLVYGLLWLYRRRQTR